MAESAASKTDELSSFLVNEIAPNIRPDKFNIMMYLCTISGDLKGHMDNLKTPRDLMLRLVERKIISPSDTKFLHNLLRTQTVGEDHLAQHLAEKFPSTHLKELLMEISLVELGTKKGELELTRTEEQKQLLKENRKVYEMKIEAIGKKDPNAIKELRDDLLKRRALIKGLQTSPSKIILCFILLSDLEYFWQRYLSGDVEEVLTSILVAPRMKEMYDDVGVIATIKVAINADEYQATKEQLLNRTVPDIDKLLKPPTATRMASGSDIPTLLKNTAAFVNGMKYQLSIGISTDEVTLIRIALLFGVHVDTTFTKRVTALHKAAGMGNLDSVKTLLMHGANGNATDEEGNTPLHIASQNGYVNVVKSLLDAQVDNNARNKDGVTPLRLVHILAHAAAQACKDAPGMFDGSQLGMVGRRLKQNLSLVEDLLIKSGAI